MVSGAAGGNEGEEMSFDRADYYDCFEGSESLSHESIEDAITAHLDNNINSPRETLQDGIRRLSPLKVYAFTRETVTPEWVKAMALRLVETVEETWADEFGDPDNPGLDSDVTEALEGVFCTGLSQALTDQQVWACRVSGSREYTAVEVEIMMRKHNPGLFWDWEVINQEDMKRPRAIRLLSQYAKGVSAAVGDIWTYDPRDLRRLAKWCEETADYLEAMEKKP